MVPISPDVHCKTDSYLNLSLERQSCESSISHRYEDGLPKGQPEGPGSANPEFTSECLRMILGDGSLTVSDFGHPLPLSSPSPEGVPRLPSPLYRTFLSERNSIDSMDWPPIESVLFPRRGNVRQDHKEGVGFKVSDISLDLSPPTFI